MNNLQPTLSLATTCKYCTAPITWKKKPSGQYIPHGIDGKDHRARCAGMSVATRATVKAASHESAVRAFLRSKREPTARNRSPYRFYR